MPITLDDGYVREAIRAMYLDGEHQAPPITAHELRMKRIRSRRRVGFKLPAAVATAVILSVVLFAATPLGHSDRRTSSDSEALAPIGWTTFSAYGIQLSVPRSWAVSYFPACPVSASGPGLLTIAPSHAGYGCPAPLHHPVAEVTLDTQNGHLGDIAQHALTINGIRVIAVALGDRTSTQWVIPSAGATVLGTGRGARSVLNTLNRATAHAVVVPGMGIGTETLSALTSVPVVGPVRVESLRTGKTTIVKALNGQLHFTGPPGRYTLTGSAGDAACAPVSVSLTSGKYSTVPPIICQGV
jgi:hypothetical protein